MKIISDNFSLDQISRSGQCFRLNAIDPDGTYIRVISGNRCLYVSQDGNEIEFECSDDEFESYWKNYFDLERDYGRFIDSVDPEDHYLAKAAAFGSGIRILDQDLWEMIVSFLISQQNNIPRIKRCIENICRRYGRRCVDIKGEEYFAFPEPEALASLPEDALMECNLGYRSKYVVRTAGNVLSGNCDLEAILKMPYQEAREELLKLYGVGGKVADCICLFALHDLDAFPVDTHIKQAFASHYPDGFPFERYKGYEGVMQQYIFYYELYGRDV